MVTMNCPNCGFNGYGNSSRAIDWEEMQTRHLTKALESMFLIAIRQETRVLNERVSYLESKLAAKEEHENS